MMAPEFECPELLHFLCITLTFVLPRCKSLTVKKEVDKCEPSQNPCENLRPEACSNAVLLCQDWKQTEPKPSKSLQMNI